MRIFATPAPAFFMREKPISSRANPACMNITRMPATITQVVSTADAVSGRLGPAAAAAAGTPSRTASAPAPAPPTSPLLAGGGRAGPGGRRAEGGELFLGEGRERSARVAARIRCECFRAEAREPERVAEERAPG